jgi:hypothetical protein
MTSFSGAKISDTRVELDNISYLNCQFERCQMVFRGIGIVQMEDCKFFDCKWVLEGPAGNTVTFLSIIYSSLGEEGRKLVNSLFDYIKNQSAQTTHEGPAE